jgi:hypothetical protein
MQLKRYLVMRRSDGAFVMGVYAQDFRLHGVANSLSGATGGHFYIDANIIASIDDVGTYQVADSMGRCEWVGRTG